MAVSRPNDGDHEEVEQQLGPYVQPSDVSFGFLHETQGASKLSKLGAIRRDADCQGRLRHRLGRKGATS